MTFSRYSTSLHETSFLFYRANWVPSSLRLPTNHFSPFSLSFFYFYPEIISVHPPFFSIFNRNQIYIGQQLARDNLVQTKDADYVNRMTHTQFAILIKSLCKSDTVHHFPGVLKYVPKTVSNDFHLYVDDGRLLEKFTKNTIGRTYRITSAVNVSEIAGDRRLRTLLDGLLALDILLPMYTLLIPFFTHITCQPTLTGKGNVGSFGTKPATTFERMLFVNLLPRLISTKNSILKRYRQVTRGSTRKCKILGQRIQGLKNSYSFNVSVVSRCQSSRKRTVIIPSVSERFCKSLHGPGIFSQTPSIFHLSMLFSALPGR